MYNAMCHIVTARPSMLFPFSQLHLHFGIILTAVKGNMSSRYDIGLISFDKRNADQRRTWSYFMNAEIQRSRNRVSAK